MSDIFLILFHFHCSYDGERIPMIIISLSVSSETQKVTRLQTAKGQSHRGVANRPPSQRNLFAKNL